MQINHPDNAPEYGAVGGGGVRGGEGSNMVNLLTGEEDAPNNYRLNVGRGGQTTTVVQPRHRHIFDQFRCIRSGYYQMGNVELEPWDIAYIPENCFYGPNTSGPDVKIIDIQFGGASGRGYPSMAQRRKGMDALRARGGRFENGLHITIDENGEQHNQDGFEALQEELWGHKVTYPEPRFTSQVFMRPRAFEWVKDPDSPGVAWKMMGRFTERDIRCAYVQVEKGATLRLGTEPAPEFVWIKEGSLSFNGTAHPAMTAFGTTSEEAPQALVATELSEMLYFKLPTF
jgi:hypothetical protein